MPLNRRRDAFRLCRRARYNPFRPPPRAPPPESSGAGSEEEEKMTDALDKAKLAKLVEIEGYDSTEELIAAVLFGFGLSRHLHERRLRLHLRLTRTPAIARTPAPIIDAAILRQLLAESVSAQ